VTEAPAAVAVPVARMHDLPKSGGLSLSVAGRTVALFEVNGEPVAYDGRCRHKGGPIGEGYVRDGVVTCPLHWWRYDLRTGQLLSDPSVRLRRYPAEVRDGIVFVTVEPVPVADPPTSIRERLLALARAEGADAAEGP
jgi:nitrite reductase/ring-hydroxylating ferredoxin subunit